MTKSFFITGTDTDVGKTWVTVALMRFFKSKGLSVVGMKPVAAGCEWIDGQWKNEDALLIQQNSSDVLEYTEINPYAYELPVSPHLAADEKQVELDEIVDRYEYLKTKADVVIVEGAGGWLVPLNDKVDIADLAKVLDIPVIMVVAIRLGCINHARLTFQAIKAANIECTGWIAVCVDPNMQKQAENIETINNKISAPLLGVLPYIEKMDFDKLVTSLFEEKLI